MTKLYYTIFNLMALSVISYMGVSLFYRTLGARLTHVDTRKSVTLKAPETKREPRLSLESLQAINERNIFNTREPVQKEIKKEEIETLEPTTLKVAPLGTVMGSGQSSWAVIEETGKRNQGLYRVGDSVQDAIIKKILRGKVVLRVGNKDQILTIKEKASRSEGRASSSPTPSRTRGRTILVRRSDLEKSLQDINSLLTNVRITPHIKDGAADGLVITRIRAGSIFRKMGIRNGDIVQGINGNPVDSVDSITSMIGEMKSGSPISVQILRRGRQRTLNYRFRD